MKPRSSLLLAVALLALAFPGLAAQPKAKAKAAPAATNAPPLLPPPIARSVFLIPATPQEGKDPFYPRSMRIFTDVLVKTNQQAVAVVAVELKLQGISGAADHRLAIINNRTFGIGEDGEVVSSSGRIRIRCEDIKSDSVRVLVNGEERVLRLRLR